MVVMMMMMMGEPSENSTVLHDFLGNKVSNFLSDSGKPVDSQFERISGDSSRNDASNSEMSNQFSGNKRNHLASDLMESSREGIPLREGIPQITSDRSNVMKMFRNANGGERPRISPYDRPLHGSPQNRPVSASFMMQQTARSLANSPKCERSNSMNLCGGSVHYNQHIKRASSVIYQMPSSRFREGASRPTVLSQLAADEGSRTSNKNSGILKSFSPSNSLSSERNLSGWVSSSCNVNPVTCTSEPKSSSSLGKQMTIIFGGQLHVFDDVHPNKADVIMALAGSNGGSWSTTLTKSSVREPTNGSCLSTRETKTSSAGDQSLPLMYDSRLFDGGNFIHALALPSSNKGATFTKAADVAGQTSEFSLKAKQEA